MIMAEDKKTRFHEGVDELPVRAAIFKQSVADEY